MRKKNFLKNMQQNKFKIIQNNQKLKNTNIKVLKRIINKKLKVQNYNYYEYFIRIRCRFKQPLCKINKN